jgi:hypothetical protein
MSHLEAPKNQSVCKINCLSNKFNEDLPKIRKVGCYMKV